MKHWYALVILCALGSALSSSPRASAAGGSSSGGGELLEDGLNPWFLEGDQEVTYCIARADDFSVPSLVLDQLVATAFTFWHEEFSNAYIPNNLEGVSGTPLRVRVKTSGFVQKDCSEQTDLAFQFGTLTEAQGRYVAARGIDIRRYVAFSGRLAYDPVKLKGKGFLYVSPDRGAKAFQGRNVAAEAWTIDGSKRLGKVLMHELGHVFGLPHIGGPGDLMGQEFPETIVDQTLSSYLPFLQQTVFHPHPGPKLDVCFTAGIKPERLKRFFQLDPAEPCVAISFDLDALRVLVRADDSMPWREAGRAEFATAGQRRYQRAVAVWMPPEQRVFPAVANILKSLVGPSIVQVQMSGTYRSTDGKVVRPVFVQDDPRNFQIGGVVDGEMWPDVLGGYFPLAGFGIGEAQSGWVDAVFNAGSRQ